MGAKICQIMSMVLKLLAMAVGVPAVIFGLFIGVIGIGPDGPGIPFYVRLLGIWVLVLGVLYFVPNKKLKQRRWSTLGYLVLNLLPTLAFGIASYITISDSGMDTFVRDGGPGTVSTFVPLSLLAPLSLIFSMLAARASRPQEPVNFSGTVGSGSRDQSPEHSDGTTAQSHKS